MALQNDKITQLSKYRDLYKTSQTFFFLSNHISIQEKIHTSPFTTIVTPSFPLFSHSSPSGHSFVHATKNFLLCEKKSITNPLLVHRSLFFEKQHEIQLTFKLIHSKKMASTNMNFTLALKVISTILTFPTGSRLHLKLIWRLVLS